MKNLPDKIYLNFGDITKEEFEENDYNEYCKIDEYAVTYCEDKVYDCDVEYVRTDAFIEKAVEWWMDNFVYTDDVEIKYDTIQSFKNYMKGE